MDRTNVDKEEKGAIAGSSGSSGSSADQSKEKLKTSGAVASSVQTGILLGSTSRPENDLTGVLDSSQEEVASNSAQNEGLEAQNPVDNDHNGVGDADNIVVDDGNVDDDDNIVNDDGNVDDDDNIVNDDGNVDGDDNIVDVDDNFDDNVDNGNAVEQDSDGDDGNVGDHILNVDAVYGDNQGVVGEIASAQSARRTRQRYRRPVPNDVPPGYAAMPPPHVCQPVCGICCIPMNIQAFELIYQQNIILTQDKISLHQRVLTINRELTQAQENIIHLEGVLQRCNSDCEDNYNLMMFFHKELTERKKKVKQMEEEMEILKNKCKISEEAYQMENEHVESMHNLHKELCQTTEMIQENNRQIEIEKLQEQNRSSALETQNQELCEQVQCLTTQIELVTEKASREADLYALRVAQIESCLQEEVNNLNEVFLCLQTLRHRPQLPIRQPATLEE